MPYNKVILRPGVNVEQTPLLNEASWSLSNLVRFFNGLLQKIGGWTRLSNSTLQGVCRGMLAWADLSSNAYVACGTEQRLQLFTAGVLYDITPVRQTDNIPPNYSTVLGSNIVTITDTTPSNVSAGDGVLILNPIAVGGLILQGNYAVQSVIDANNFTISAASNALTTVNNAGSAVGFITTNGSNSIQVVLPNNGYAVNSVYTVYVQTIVGGITLTVGDYIVQSIIDANNFTINAAGSASSNANGFENGGNSRLEYLLPAGLVSAGIAEGYGDGGYGLGGYGVGGSSVPSALRQWTMGAFGQDLIAAPTQGSIYLWNPALGLFENPATLMSVNAPAVVEGLFIAMPQQQIVAFGCTDPNTGNQDPMLIRWCDVADFTDWTATAANQAGSFRLPRGSKIVGGIQGPQYGLLWTDLGLWAMSYVQPPLVYGFNEISEGCGLISLRAMCILGVNIFWMSYNGFFVYSGGTVTFIPCDVWDVLFLNLNFAQLDKITMGANSHFNEFFLFYPSNTGNGENDSYVKATILPGGIVWDYGSLIRTAWVDQSIFTGNNPLAVDGAHLIQQHESGNDADGQPIIATATSGWFKLENGELYVFLDRMIPDFVLKGGATVNITIYTADYPTDSPNVYGPYSVTSSTEYFIIRSRSRLARIQISSLGDLGTFWRLGEILYLGAPAGKR